MEETLICDIECDGLYDNVTKIHCIAIKEKGDENVKVYYDGDIDAPSGDRSSSIQPDNYGGSIQRGVDRLSNAGLVIGHNWIDYDARVIRKFYPEYKINTSRIRDTLLRSYLFNPGRRKHADCPVSKTTIAGRKQIGAHSLENFGYVVGRGKVEHEDWSVLTHDMIHRCIEDVHITDLVDNYLEHEADGWDWSEAEKIEKQFRFILSEQEGHGVLVDQDHIDWCLEQLQAEVNKIEEEVLPQIPLNVVGTEKPTKGMRADMSPSTYAEKYIGHSSICGDFCKVEFNQINLNSDKQIKEYLLSQGWEPKEWNYKKDGKQILKDTEGKAIKTSPKITEDSLGSVSGAAGRLISRRITVRHRFSQISGWKDNIRCDGRIGAGGNSVGTNTGRVTHRRVVNVPKAEDGIFFGKEMRSVFIAPLAYKMVGADLSALENRIAAHYTFSYDDGEYAERTLKGDPHQYIADMLGIERSPAKNINYGIMYGAGVAKVQSMLGGSFAQAKFRYGQWWDANPALKTLRAAIKRALESHPGFIKGIDGRKIFVRSEHSAMNALFQCAGSVVNKVSTILIYKAMKREGIRGHFVINMHDEIQAEIHQEDVDKYSKIVLECYIKAGEYFDLNIPIEGEAKVGSNWAETH